MAQINCQCGQHYDGDIHPTCPFCGVENPEFDASKASRILNERQKALQREELFNDWLKQQAEVLKNGNQTITPTKTKVWEVPGVFWSIAAAIGVIILIIVLVMTPNANYLRGGQEDFYIGGWIYSIGSIFIYASRILQGYLDNQPFDILPSDGNSPSSLGTTNSIGITMLGGFRQYGMSSVSYEFLCLFIPLIPVGCYRCEIGPTTSGYKKTSTSYRFYGSDKMKALELLQIYLGSWGWLPFIFGIFSMVIAMFD